MVIISLALFANVFTNRSSRLTRQVLEPRQTLDFECSSCQERLKETPPQTCCRCIDEGATCNNEIATNKTFPGLKCNNIECDLFDDCDPDQSGCKVQALTVVDVADVVDLRQIDQQKCPSGQKLCCNPGPGGVFEKQLGPLIGDNPSGRVIVDTVAICQDSKLSAVQDFGHGITCGKRDSR